MFAKLVRGFALSLLVTTHLHAQDPAAEPPPRDVEVQRVLDGWIRAGEERGPFHAELRRMTYDYAFSTLRVSDEQLWAVDPTRWRYDSGPAVDIDERQTVSSGGRDYTVQFPSPERWVRTPESFFRIDVAGKRFLQYDRKLIPDFVIDSIEWQAMVVFPHLHRGDFDTWDIQLGPLDQREGEQKVHHLVFTPRTAAMQLNVAKFEVLIDPDTHLLRAAQGHHPAQTGRTVYRLKSQRKLMADEWDRMVPPYNSERLERAGFIRANP